MNAFKLTPTSTLAFNINISLPRERFNVEASLRLPMHGVTVILGESGSGKTSLLRAIAGLERGVGEVMFGNSVWQNSKTKFFLPTWQRELGFVFQEPSLFSTMSVAKNLYYAEVQGRHRTLRKSSIKNIAPLAPNTHNINIDNWISQLGIDTLMCRSAHELSGGERQRVAIARALIGNPKVLLFDEPLSAIDERSRRELLPYLLRLCRESLLPMIIVTHSWAEATQLADVLVLMEEGQVCAASPIQDWMPDLTDEALWQKWLTWPIHFRESAGVVVNGVVSMHDKAWHLQRLDFAGGQVWVREHEAKVGDNLRFRILAKDVSLVTDTNGDNGSSTIQNRVLAKINVIRDDTHPAFSWVQLQTIANNESANAPTLRFYAKITKRAINLLQLHAGMKVQAHIKAVAVLD